MFSHHVGTTTSREKGLRSGGEREREREEQPSSPTNSVLRAGRQDSSANNTRPLRGSQNGGDKPASSLGRAAQLQRIFCCCEMMGDVKGDCMNGRERERERERVGQWATMPT